MKDFSSGASKITCGMGEIVVRGELYGKCTIDCGMGSVRLNIREPEHFGYRTSVGMGEVRIGENKLRLPLQNKSSIMEKTVGRRRARAYDNISDQQRQFLTEVSGHKFRD